MNAQCGASPHPKGGNGDSDLEPRVVILDSGETTSVEILELPKSATLGFSFCRCGRNWRVTGRRTADRVLIASPVEP